MKTIKLVLISFFVLALSACGTSFGGGPTPTNTPTVAPVVVVVTATAEAPVVCLNGTYHGFTVDINRGQSQTLSDGTTIICDKNGNLSFDSAPSTTLDTPVAQSQASSNTAQQNPSSGTYNIPPQMQIGHPSVYVETGVPDPISGTDAHTKRWVLDVLQGTVAIVGGFTVDGISNGVYKAIEGPARLDTTVTNGFLAITIDEWGNGEFCFRIGQAIQFGWAHNTEQPLPGWTSCSNQPVAQIQSTSVPQATSAPVAATPVPQQNKPAATAAPSTSKGQRRTTENAPNKTITFTEGEPVIGFSIKLSDGKTYSQCYLANPPRGGTVTDGVVWPWDAEIAATKPCTP